MTYAKAATQRKGQSQCLLFPNMSLKKIKHCYTESKLPKNLQNSFQKVSELSEEIEEIVNSMKLVM